VIKENKIVGAVLFGETIDSHKVLDYIQKETDISEIMNASIFKTGESKESVLANYAPEDVICGCNGVSKQMITDAIVAGSCTLDEVKACTKAGKSCGGCIGVVNAILEETLGDEFKESSNKTPICSCTNLSKEELVEAIKEKGLMLSKEIRMVLDWKNEDGCSKCRPALNYYLGMLYPIDHVDEKESRFVNERLHANIQKDGTYGVMPRMYGGVTNPNDLKKIAEVAEKYNVPLIKVTGAQRLNLLGVKKDDLPKIWEELDMPSGYAYGKSLRMVKTCVGKDFCRFGTVDSIGLGIKLEKALEGIQTPHKLKMSVSACPRNCAEAGIKDIGIVGLDGVWEIYVGGNAGVDLRAGDLLYRVKAEEEMIDIIFAFLQFYREDARYLERTSHWIERVGLDKIKNVLDDVDKRKELKERLEIALSTHEDPWKKIVEDEKTRKELFETVVITSGGENVGN
jgi:nitrite reductase (NADH) large subunit